MADKRLAVGAKKAAGFLPPSTIDRQKSSSKLVTWLNSIHGQIAVAVAGSLIVAAGTFYGMFGQFAKYHGLTTLI